MIINLYILFCLVYVSGFGENKIKLGHIRIIFEK